MRISDLNDSAIGEKYDRDAKQSHSRLISLAITVLFATVTTLYCVGLVSLFIHDSDVNIDIWSAFPEGVKQLQNLLREHEIVPIYIGLLAVVATVTISLSITDTRSFSKHSIDTQVSVSRWKESAVTFLRITSLITTTFLLLYMLAFDTRSSDYWFQATFLTFASGAIIWLSNIATSKQLSVEYSIRRHQLRKQLAKITYHADKIDPNILNHSKHLAGTPGLWRLFTLQVLLLLDTSIIWLLVTPQDSTARWWILLGGVIILSIINSVYVLASLRVTLSHASRVDRFVSMASSWAVTTFLAILPLDLVFSTVDSNRSTIHPQYLTSILIILTLFSSPYIIHYGGRFGWLIFRSIYLPTKGRVTDNIRSTVKDLERQISELSAAESSNS